MLSRAPDLLRVTEIVGLLIIVTLFVHVRRRRIDWKSPAVLFIGSCAATPFVVFNQQVVTGVSLQSFHYEQFVINYLVLVGIVTTYHLLWSHLKIRPIVWAVFALCIGLATALKEVHDNLAVNVRRDQAKPVFERLNKSGVAGLTLFNNSLVAASALTDSSAPQLWAPSMHFFGGIDAAERLERFYQYLYLLGVEPRTFEHDLQNSPHVRAAVFGLHRVNPTLTQTFTPVSTEEIRVQVEAYSAYVKAFSQEHANRRPLAYVIMIDDEVYDLTNLDRWYTRSAGEKVGNTVIFRVRLQNSE